MIIAKTIEVRENLRSFCDKVFNGETLIISRPKNENVVMISEKEYNEVFCINNNKAERTAENDNLLI